ncbi:hypothetical protein C8Q80DRAFT_1190793 [Daedaleopsis nitida]|nr:hypothetical protein C8Q80DRAFT_1190793 [Daedaleopsis nitida]
MSEQQRIPTVDDLRVKLCYICREEERYDNPEDPPRAWTHPCSCTLVAHESCLLQWIKAAQQDPARVDNALKCPQCGAIYELESDNPRILRIANAVNAALSTAGKLTTVLGVVGLVTSFGFSIYVVSTSYGAFAVKEFLGETMYNLLLTDDPNNWPWHAFVHLPMIPFSLILSRTRLFDTFPLVPLFFSWTTSPPVRPSAQSSSSLSSLWSRPASTYHPNPAINWPPTPFMTMVFFPFIRIAYRRFFAKLTQYVMGTHPDAGRDRAGRIRRVIWDLNEDAGPLRVRIGANVQQGNDRGGQNDPARPNANPNEAVADDPPEDAGVAGERTLRISTSTIGRFVGGALLIPTISNRMGTLLFRLSAYSPLLRAFLAIRDRPLSPSYPAQQIRLFNTPPGSNASLMGQIGAGLVAGLNILCGGTPAWSAQDPVWWRNAVGLGLFCFGKDCVRLLYLYLTRRELESRKVKNRSFAGVDIRELDLIHPVAGSTSSAPAPPPLSDPTPPPSSSAGDDGPIAAS